MLLKSVRKTDIRVVMVAVLATLGLALSIGAVQQVSAQTAANTLQVSPLRTDIEVAPGETGTVKIRVTNPADEAIVIKPVQNDFIAGDENGTPAIILDENEFAPSHSLKRFLAPIAEATIEPGATATVEAVINVPADAQAGGYFGAVRFIPSSAATGGQVNLSASVASLILLTVSGDLVDNIEIKEFDIVQGDKSGAAFFEPKDLKLTTLIENKGNVQAGPFGKISVKSGNSVVYEADFNANDPKDVILPDSSRRWDVPLENIGAFGVYTVLATITYGKSNQTIEIAKTFWVVPPYVIAIAAAILLALVVWVVWLVFFRNKRKKFRKK